MIKTYFISDTHFLHANIIKYEERPFKNIDEMTEQMITNWNNTVRKDDRVFFLGDFGLGPVDKLTAICKRLHGYKTLIMGNHDRSRNTMLAIGFDEVSKYPIVYKDFYILSHKPMYVNIGSTPYVNIHGHIHSAKYGDDQHVNVCVECIDYTPIEFEKIKKLYV